MSLIRVVSALLVVGALTACADSATGPSRAPGSARFDASANSNAATVDHDAGLCGMPGSDANGNLIFGGVGTIKVVVENGNKVMIKCTGNPITNLSGRAQNFDGFGCGIISNSQFYFTTDSHANVSASN